MIPRTIHQIWLGTAEMHPLMVVWRKKWIDLHPGWYFPLWTESEDGQRLKVWGESESSPYVVIPNGEQQALLKRACHLSQRSNIWRYLIVMNFGGLYVDTDVEPYKPIDLLIGQSKAVTARRSIPYFKRECAFFGAEPKHPWVCHLVSALPTKVPEITLSMGTTFFTEITVQHPEVDVLPELAVVFKEPFDWEQSKREERLPDENEIPSPLTYAKHHWSSIWYPKGFVERPRG